MGGGCTYRPQVHKKQNMLRNWFALKCILYAIDRLEERLEAGKFVAYMEYEWLIMFTITCAREASAAMRPQFNECKKILIDLENKSTAPRPHPNDWNPSWRPVDLDVIVDLKKPE